MDKPRITLAQFRAMQQQKTETVAQVIDQYISERSQPGGRTLGLSHRYILGMVRRYPIAAKKLAELKPMDFVVHCKARRATGVLPQTVNQDMTYLSGAIKYADEIWGIPEAEEAYKAYRRAKPQLVKEQLIGKSMPRDRRPTPDELERLLALFELPPKKVCKNFIPMVPIVKFSYLTGRRISETCRITWGDLDHDKRTCTVRDLKNSKGKGFHDTFPLLGEAWALVLAQPKVGDRIFPYNPKSCGAKYTIAKKNLGIVNLRLHDNRRHCFSGLFEQGYSVPEVQKVSLHRNATILLKNYTALKPEDLHLGPASKRSSNAAREEIHNVAHEDRDYIDLRNLTPEHPLRNTLLIDLCAEFKHASWDEYRPLERGKPLAKNTYNTLVGDWMDFYKWRVPAHGGTNV